MVTNVLAVKVEQTSPTDQPTVELVGVVADEPRFGGPLRLTWRRNCEHCGQVIVDEAL